MFSVSLVNNQLWEATDLINHSSQNKKPAVLGSLHWEVFFQFLLGYLQHQGAHYLVAWLCFRTVSLQLPIAFIWF